MSSSKICSTRDNRTRSVARISTEVDDTFARKVTFVVGNTDVMENEVIQSASMTVDRPPCAILRPSSPYHYRRQTYELPRNS